jgi:hypothetical protein
VPRSFSYDGTRDGAVVMNLVVAYHNLSTGSAGPIARTFLFVVCFGGCLCARADEGNLTAVHGFARRNTLSSDFSSCRNFYQ